MMQNPTLSSSLFLPVAMDHVIVLSHSLLHLVSPSNKGKKTKEMRFSISLLLSLITLFPLLILYYTNVCISSPVQSREGRSSSVDDDPDILPLLSTNNNNNKNNTAPTIKEMRVDDLYQYALFKSPRFRSEKDARRLRHFLSTHPQPKWDKKKGRVPELEEGLKQKHNTEPHLLL